MTGARPFRLGFFSYLAGDRPQAEIYAEVSELFVAADELGFDVGWVAQAHFAGAHGGLPSPLVFFSTVASLTRQISLGTAVVTLPLEDPIRVAEDAAVFEALTRDDSSSGSALALRSREPPAPSTVTSTAGASPTTRRSRSWAGRCAVSRWGRTRRCSIRQAAPWLGASGRVRRPLTV